MNDSLHNKVRFRTFNVIDDYNREVLSTDVADGLRYDIGDRSTISSGTVAGGDGTASESEKRY